MNTTLMHKFTVMYTRGNLTPVLELEMRVSCPDVVENVSFKFPGPISTVSFCATSILDMKPCFLPVSLQYKGTLNKEMYLELLEKNMMDREVH